MSVSGERDHWKEPSKYLETWELKHAKSCWRIFSQKRPLGKKESREDKLAKSKRVRIGVNSFAGSFASKALAVWLYLPQLRGSWLSFDQRSKSQHNCRHNGNTHFQLNFAEQSHQRVTLGFSLGTQRHSLEHHGGHSLSVKQEVLVTSNRAISRAIFQHRQFNL